MEKSMQKRAWILILNWTETYQEACTKLTKAARDIWYFKKTYLLLAASPVGLCVILLQKLPDWEDCVCKQSIIKGREMLFIDWQKGISQVRAVQHFH